MGIISDVPVENEVSYDDYPVNTDPEDISQLMGKSSLLSKATTYFLTSPYLIEINLFDLVIGFGY